MKKQKSDDVPDVEHMILEQWLPSQSHPERYLSSETLARLRSLVKGGAVPHQDQTNDAGTTT